MKSFHLVKIERKRDKIILGIFVGAILIFLSASLWFRYEERQFSGVFKNVADPSWVLVDREQYGNRICEKTCIGESQEYITSITRENALEVFEKKIKEQGYVIVKKDNECGNKTRHESTVTVCSVTGKKDDLYLSMSLNVIDRHLSQDVKDGTRVSIHFGHTTYFWGIFKNISLN